LKFEEIKTRREKKEKAFFLVYSKAVLLSYLSEGYCLRHRQNFLIKLSK